jgi:hypothetical protein
MYPRFRKLDNPREAAELHLENLRKKKGWSETHPTFRREWLGMWVRDAGGLVWHGYLPERNDFSVLPDIGWTTVMGVDLGTTNPFTIVVLGWNLDVSPHLWVVDQYKKSGLVVSDWAKRIAEYQEKWDPLSTRVDTGGLGKAIVEDMVVRFGLPLQAAEKRNKRDYIETGNSDMYAGHVLIEKGSPLAQEMAINQWDEDRKKEDKRFANDMCDAFLYAHHEAKHWLHEPIPEPIKSLVEYQKLEMEEHKATLAKELMKAKDGSRSRRSHWLDEE